LLLGTPNKKPLPWRSVKANSFPHGGEGQMREQENKDELTKLKIFFLF
jgi:hypothetical protein